MDLITLETRLEGDTAVDLGNDLRCDVVARAIAQIDETDIERSLPRMVDRLRCSTTTDSNDVLTATFFHDQLYPKFRAAVERVVTQADYLHLLEEPNHRGQLQKSFATELQTVLADCGFSLITSEIRFRPLDPGITALTDPRIAEKWIRQLETRDTLEVKKRKALEAIQEEDRRNAAEQAAETERRLKEIELLKKQAERDYEAQLHKLELEMERQRNEKEIAAGEIRHERDDYFLKRQEEKAAYEQRAKIRELQDREALKGLEDDEARGRDKTRIQHENEMRDAKLTALERSREIAELRFATTKLEAEAEKIRGLAQADVIEARVRAENTLERDQITASAQSLEKLIERLPEFAARMTTDDRADRTVIQIGRDIDSDVLSSRFGVLGLLLLPLIKDLSQKLSTCLDRTVSPSTTAKTPTESTDGEPEQSGLKETDAESLHKRKAV